MVDHGLQCFVVGSLVSLHVALLMNSLELCVVGIVHDYHHHAWLVYQNLKSFQRKLIGVIINI